MQKNENQNRWAPIVVGITEPYPRLYLHPWVRREESSTVFFSALHQRQEFKKHLQQYVYTSQKFAPQSSNVHCCFRHEDPITLDLSLNRSFSCVFYSFASKAKNKKKILLSHFLSCEWNSSQRAPAVADRVLLVAGEQRLILWWQCFAPLTDTPKRRTAVRTYLSVWL